MNIIARHDRILNFKLKNLEKDLKKNTDDKYKKIAFKKIHPLTVKPKKSEN